MTTSSPKWAVTSGSTIAGIVVAATALTVSLPLCMATIAFFVIDRFAEDDGLVPRITVQGFPDLVSFGLPGHPMVPR